MLEANSSHATNSRQRAEALVENIPDEYVRKTALSTLRGTATINEMVKAFHLVYGMPIVRPSDARMDFSHITRERLAMRFALIAEEFMELCEAMDIRCEMNFLYEDEDGVYRSARSVKEMETAERGVDLGGTALYPGLEVYGHKDLVLLDHDNLSDEDHHLITRQRLREAIENTEARDMAGVADATFDLKYVIVGFEYEVGIDPQFCANEGQASNLSKLMPDGTVLRREDGKVMKGPNTFKPDMKAALGAWGMRTCSNPFDPE